MTDADRLAQARAEIDRMYRGLDSRDHFQLLGVDQDTDKEALRAAYHHLAKRFHTDNYAGMNLGPAQKKLDEIFQRIGEAYETLSDPKLREEYMTLVRRKQAGLSTDVNAILRAESLVDEAVMEIRRKAWPAAHDKLVEARKLNPDDPLYDVHLAWVIYNQHLQDPNQTRKAMDILRNATRRQESLPLAYQYGGQMAFNQEDYGEARRWWKKCLEWEPKNVEAQRGLRLINTRLEKKKQGLGGFLNRLLKKG